MGCNLHAASLFICILSINPEGVIQVCLSESPFTLCMPQTTLSLPGKLFALRVFSQINMAVFYNLNSISPIKNMLLIEASGQQVSISFYHKLSFSVQRNASQRLSVVISHMIQMWQIRFSWKMVEFSFKIKLYVWRSSE